MIPLSHAYNPRTLMLNNNYNLITKSISKRYLAMVNILKIDSANTLKDVNLGESALKSARRILVKNLG